MGPDPTADRIRDAFRLLETAAIRAGHGAVVDGWQPDVAWLRGEDANRRSDALRSPVTGASLEG